MDPLPLSDEERGLLERAASEGRPAAVAALADGDEALAWRGYVRAARKMGHLDLDREVTPALEDCPACGRHTFAEHAFGIGETVSSSTGPRNVLGHAGDEHHAWVLLMLCLACDHEGELLVDTGDPLYV